jgi:predicted metal-dependent phosphoesterase TrpH
MHFSIDLHAHTTASDGTYTPTELVDHAREKGLTAIAVTDHDTVDGLPEAAEAARRREIEFVPGIELSISYHTGRFHMLGYLIDWENPTLAGRLQQLKINRIKRNQLMAAKMEELGLPVTLEDIVAESGGGQVGRPHMAMAMVKKGLVSTVQEAFDKYLGDGAMAHFPKDKITAEEGLELIHAAGGLAVMAHPSSLKLDNAALREDLKHLKELGLDGIECYYNNHTPERSRELLAMAEEVGLVATGGSDFHGAAKPNVFLGVVVEGKPVPDSVLAALKQRKAQRFEAVGA